jgi:RNA polymerase sigma-70 factor, ECF subfamily
LAQRNLQQFETLFRELFPPLTGFALKYVGDPDDAKGVVHDVFVNLWDKFENLPTDSNLKSYLYTAVKNRCLNTIRDKRKHVTIDAVPEGALAESNSAMETAELEAEIEIGIASLPDKCRMVFVLNRKQGLKYAQIAEQLGISVKTVEAQMTKAMSILRTHLKEFLSIIFLMFQ